MNVLFFLPNLSGYLDRAQLLLEVSRGLDRLILLVGIADASVELSAYPRVELIEVGFRRGRRLHNLWRANQLAWRLVRERSVHVVHDTFGTLLPLMFLRRYLPTARFCASFFILNGWRIREAWKGVPFWKLLTNRSTAAMYYGALIERLTCKGADVVVLQAPGLVHQLKAVEHITGDKLAVITNNVNTSDWNPGWTRAEPCEDGRVRLLFVGSVGITRGAMVLLQAMRLLRQAGCPATLTMVGGWEPFTQPIVRQFLREHGLEEAVIFTGRLPRSGLLKALHEHDLFLYQTINDGSPRTVLEAMASGIPIIASHHPGIDVLDPAGGVIAFTDYGDADRVAALVQDFVADPAPWRERGAAGRLLAEERFRSEVVAAQYLQLYRRLAARSG